MHTTIVAKRFENDINITFSQSPSSHNAFYSFMEQPAIKQK